MSTQSLGSPQVLYIFSRDTINLGSDTQNQRANPVLTDLINFQTAGLSGAAIIDSIALMPNTTQLAYAFCTLSYSSGSGTVGAYVNGVAGTVTWATSDAASMAATVTAFNALTDAHIKGIAKMGYAAAITVTCASVAAGDSVTLSGITLTAVAGTRAFRQFSKDTSDTATGADLAAAINQDPILGHFWAAVNASGTVSVYPRFPTATAPAGLSGVIVSSSSNTTLAVTQLTAGATAAICAVLPGVQGNCISVIATGTGATIGATASPTQAYASGNKLMAAGSGADDAATTRYFGILP